MRGTGHEHGFYRIVNYDFINLSLFKEVDGVPIPDVFISFESFFSAYNESGKFDRFKSKN